MTYHNIYVGIRYRDVPFVAVNGKPLSPRLDLIEHSSKGFEWVSILKNHPRIISKQPNFYNS